ncbi:nose resistant to fluoxetine protein 6-like [Pieris napi]|uniref:nose resistant to fluoxetine protein 6-like n=1 Tax=Pieris napi TaxID=78633 RepID=UPI001FB97E8C|nr:nose resistant to fluoxetine protein 6-like [Pieris napi]
MFFVLILFLLFGRSACVIYSLNETDYFKMPPLYEMEDYNVCMTEAEGTYCIADFDLFSRSRSPLMHLIQQYSAYTKKHYNHTQIHRGLCVTRTCKDYIENFNKTMALNATLGPCLNETIWKDYGIEAKLSRIQYCKRKDDKKVIGYGTFAIIGVYGLVLLLNMIGTFYETILSKDENRTGNKYLLAFSLKRNWKRLVAPSGKGSDERLNKLKALNGLRSMTMVCVIFSHTALTLAFTYIENPLYFEKAYDDPFKQILFNGTLVTMTFFVMSAFLLVYNFLIHAESHEITWVDFPKGVLLRWIRLTPTYALLIGTIGCIVPYFGDGPLWQLTVTSESDACRNKWWTNILYINNYMYSDSNCMPQSWYLAADTQLFCFSLLVLVIARTPRSRKIAIWLMFLMSMVITATITYYQKLDATVIQTPESYRNLYSTNPTFKAVYVPGHTNLSSYVIGFIAALLTYKWHNEKKDFSKYRSYLWAYWLVFPAGVLIILSGGFFYIDGLEPSQVFKTIYATFYKIVFQILVTIIMVGCFFKYDNVYRVICEWRGFTWMGRISYAAFLVHTLFQRCLLGIQMKPMYVSDFYVSVLLHSSIFTSYLLGVSLYLFVESPVAGLVKAVLTPTRRKTEQENNK